jgi:uncharacterized membrane protein YfcA
VTVPWELAAAGGLFVALASFLRGLTGFGFAIVATPLLALVLPPALAAPIVVALQIPAGLQTAASDWRDTDLRAASLACLGGLPAILPGLWLVAALPAETMRLVVGVVVILSTVLLSFGFRLGRAPRTHELLGSGAMSGFLMGAVAMAGPPVIVLLLASDWAAKRCRATLSLIFFMLGCATFALGLANGVVTLESLGLTALYAPGLFAGQVLGGTLFSRIDGRRYRAVSLVIVAATGFLVVIRGILEH